jgi:hypothetical protein
MASLIDLTWYQPQCESAQGEARNTQMQGVGMTRIWVELPVPVPVSLDLTHTRQRVFPRPITRQGKWIPAGKNTHI